MFDIDKLSYAILVFGFAQSKALEASKDENVGLRDQRLALEWVHNNIAAFGGDPDQITIHGQSSGGLAVGMQIMAYGAKRPVPFSGAICESQAVEPDITSNVTRKAQTRILAKVDCNKFDYDSMEAVECLRQLPLQTLLHAQLDTAQDGLDSNVGDEWLPVVDHAFLPAAPSELIRQRRLANVSMMVGWMAQDAVPFTTLGPKQGARTFLEEYAPALSSENRNKALALYPLSEFHSSYAPNGTVSVRAEVFRAARMFRDILFTCSAVSLAERVAQAGNPVFLFHQNQTILTAQQHSQGEYGWGVVHTSEIAYVFGNLTYYLTNASDVNPVNFMPSDYELANRQSRSWSSFTALRRPSLEGHDTLQGWKEAQFEDCNLGAFVVGGPTPGFAGTGGSAPARRALESERLFERCQFWNSREVVQQLQY